MRELNIKICDMEYLLNNGKTGYCEENNYSVNEFFELNEFRACLIDRFSDFVVSDDMEEYELDEFEMTHTVLIMMKFEGEEGFPDIAMLTGTMDSRLGCILEIFKYINLLM